jgi:hypothetical protein
MGENALETFVVYDHPSDFPNSYVVRRHVVIESRVIPDPVPFLVGPDLDGIREVLECRGLYRLNRQEEDDPVIVEVWL